MPITGNYGSHTKDELLAEVAERALPNITGDMTKADIIAALQLNDEERAEAEAAAQPDDTEALKARILQLEASLAAGNKTIVPVTSTLVGPPIVAKPTRHDLDTFNKGKFKDRKTGEVFSLRINPEGFYGRTHELANNEHFRDMTPEQFEDTMLPAS